MYKYRDKFLELDDGRNIIKYIFFVGKYKTSKKKKVSSNNSCDRNCVLKPQIKFYSSRKFLASVLLSFLSLSSKNLPIVLFNSFYSKFRQNKKKKNE